MKTTRTTSSFAALTLLFLAPHFSNCSAFEGRITASITRDGDAQTFLYTVVTNRLRIERGETNWPHAKNIVSLDAGTIILLFPHNRSFIRLKNVPPAPALPNSPAGFPVVPTIPATPAGLPPGVGPQTTAPNSPALPSAATIPGRVSPTILPGALAPPPMPQLPPGLGPQPNGAGGMPAFPMPMTPPMPMQQAELKTTGDTTNLLGYVCKKFELRQRGEIMEIWATDKLLAFQPYLQNQPHRFGPRMIEEQWGELLKAKKLFPLLVVLKFEQGGQERLRFEVKGIKPENIEDKDGALFTPPPGYQEIQPLPF